MNILWRLQRKIRKTMIAHSSDPRPSSYPFISGDTFRKMADHIYDMSGGFDPETVKRGDIVFVQSDIIDKYFQKVHPLINDPYILITHNGDRNISDKELLYIDNKIIHWFAQNVLIEHPKISAIPIGIENAHYANAGLTSLYQYKLMPKAERVPRVLVAFNIDSNPIDRQTAFDSLSKDAKSDILSRRVNQPEYVGLVKKYCFVASPPGNGEDCIRTWETMLLGAIPIVERSIGMKYFSNLGLPMFLINTWDELGSYTEYDLSVKYDLIMSQANRDPLNMKYWEAMIQNKKTNA